MSDDDDSSPNDVLGFQLCVHYLCIQKLYFDYQRTAASVAGEPTNEFINLPALHSMLNVMVTDT
jgi:hypothetical protein